MTSQSQSSLSSTSASRLQSTGRVDASFSEGTTIEQRCLVFIALQPFVSTYLQNLRWHPCQDGVWRDIAIFRNDCASPDYTMVPDTAAHQDCRICANEHIIPDDSRLAFNLIEPSLADASTHCAMGVNVRTCRDITAFTNRQATTAINNCKSANPSTLANSGFTDYPGMAVVGVWRKAMPRFEVSFLGHEENFFHTHSMT